MQTNEKLYCVYKHTGPNGKVYIGMTCQDPEKRWCNGSGYKSNKHFYQAIQKYGWDNFEHEILFDGLSHDDACQKEMELISYYDSTNPDKGYNRSTGGDNGGSGYRHSYEAKQKISIANKGRKKSEEAKRKMRENHCDVRGENNPNYGKPRPDDVKKKISQALKGRPSRRKGIPLSEETKRKLSASKVGRFCGKDNPNYGNHKIAGENHPNYGNGFPVVQFDKEGRRIAEYRTSGDAEEATGVWQSNIRRCCRGEVRSAGGFMWRLVKDCPCGDIEPYETLLHTDIEQLYND